MLAREWSFEVRWRSLNWLLTFGCCSTGSLRQVVNVGLICKPATGRERERHGSFGAGRTIGRIVSRIKPSAKSCSTSLIGGAGRAWIFEDIPRVNLMYWLVPEIGVSRRQRRLIEMTTAATLIDAHHLSVRNSKWTADDGRRTTDDALRRPRLSPRFSLGLHPPQN